MGTVMDLFETDLRFITQKQTAGSSGIRTRDGSSTRRQIPLRSRVSERKSSSGAFNGAAARRDGSPCLGTSWHKATPTIRSNVPFFFKRWGGVRKKETGRKLAGRMWDEIPREAANR